MPEDRWFPPLAKREEHDPCPFCSGVIRKGDYACADSGHRNISEPDEREVKMSRPAEDPRGEWTYRCTSCGDEIDQDHDYCGPCDQRGGEWELVDEDGEPIDTNIYGIETFQELVTAADHFLKRLEEVCNEPDMQKKIDEHGNEAARRVRGGIRVAKESLRDVIWRAKQTKEIP